MIRKTLNLRRKGQAALEFLTTYGWAFMVILVMIGALAYFGVLNPQNLIPDQCAITSGFSCRDTFVSNESIMISAVNNMGEPIYVVGFEVKQSAGSILNKTNDADTWINISGTEYEVGARPATAIGETCSCSGDEAVPDGNSFTLGAKINTAAAGFSEGSKEKLGFELIYSKASGRFDHSATGTITQTIAE
ncbi:hypothetical protein K9L97_01920 [Candidatus Woesearchaeota archaeon]|nr:hypothetical protein [Candidatus Woesearchaeota archaeon]